MLHVLWHIREPDYPPISVCIDNHASACAENMSIDRFVLAIRIMRTGTGKLFCVRKLSMSDDFHREARESLKDETLQAKGLKCPAPVSRGQ